MLLSMLTGAAFGQTLTTLYNFGQSSKDGVPGSGVIIDKNGNLYGTTGFGGIQGTDGTVFKLTPPSSGEGNWTETYVHLFRGTPDGKIPESRPILTPQGGLVGTTLQGGANNLGTVYLLTLSASGAAKEKILHDFGSTPNDVISPNGGLFSASEGFYGADQGSTNTTGAVYLLARDSGTNSYTQNILYTFGPLGSGDAAFPSGGLVRDSKGNFYGVTAQGGANNLGAVYEVSPPATKGGAWTETVLFSFSGIDGTLPSGNLLPGPNGVFYGTTSGGGASGSGTVFQLTPPATQGGAWTETVLYAFTGGNDGGFPGSGVIMDFKGDLLGAADTAIFKLTPPQSVGGEWTESVLHNFTGPDGFIASGLTLSKGAVYGTTSEGGAFAKGTAFKLTLQ
jgi:uncharacterized repeat protein (TIGR03803 family)